MTRISFAKPVPLTFLQSYYLGNDICLMGFWNNLFKKKELPKPKSKKVGDKGYVRKPVTKPVVKKEPPKEEPPKQSFDSWESEMHQKYVEFDSDGVSNTWGDT